MNMSFKTLVVMLLMLSTAFLAWAMKPQITMAAQREKVDLATLLPEQFGSWTELKQSGRHIINPQQTAELEQLYSQTLSRSYVNTNGAMIMLSIAYGENQSRDMQVHRPEVCYSAQGFQIIASAKNSLETVNSSIPVMQLVAKQGSRNEPITYWVRIGETTVRGNIEQGFARLRYGLSGYVADGLLFRVSSISQNNKAAFDIQEKFVADLLKAVPDETRTYLLGKAI